MRPLFIIAGLALSAGGAFSQTAMGDVRNLEGAHTNTKFQLQTYLNRSDWEERRLKLRRQILVSAGLWPPQPRPAVKAHWLGRFDLPKYSIDKLFIETLPGFFVGANLYRPKNSSGKLPAVLVPHGHWKHGRIENTEDYSVPALCVNLASQGYVALAYDMVGYNDTRQTPHDFGDSQPDYMWAYGPLPLQLWNSMRALDFLESLDDVDATRMGVTGASGGGTQTFLIGAVDDRVKVSIPVVMVSATFQGDDACEMTPGLRIGTNNVEIAAMMAPRPTMLISSSQDWTKQTPQLEYPAVESVYKLMGVPDKVAFAHVDAPHNYNRTSREAAYRFLQRHLKGDVDGPAPAETETFSLNPDQLLIGWKAAQVLPAYVNDGQAAWKSMLTDRAAHMTVAERRTLMETTVGAEWPNGINVLAANSRLYLVRGGFGERLPAQWVRGRKPVAVLMVHPDGAEAGRKTKEARRFIAEGKSLLALDVYQTGVAIAPHPPRRRDYLTFHRSDDANRVQDIITGIAFLKARGSDRIRLNCPGRAIGWCILAAAVSKVPVVIDDDHAPLPASDDELRKLAFIPGLQVAGGLRMALWLSQQNSGTPDLSASAHAQE